MKFPFLKSVFLGVLLGGIALLSMGAAIDTNGNPLTDNTDMGDIDMDATTVGDFKGVVSPNYSNVSNAAMSAAAATNDFVRKSGSTMDNGSILNTSHLFVSGLLPDGVDMSDPHYTSYGRKEINVGVDGMFTWQLLFPQKSGVFALTNDFSKLAFTGSYADITNRPTNVSSFTNDAHYATSNDVRNIIEEVEGSGTNVTFTVDASELSVSTNGAVVWSSDNFVKKSGNEAIEGRLSITGESAALAVTGSSTNAAILTPGAITLMRPGNPYTAYKLTLPEPAETNGTLALQSDTYLTSTQLTNTWTVYNADTGEKATSYYQIYSTNSTEGAWRMYNTRARRNISTPRGTPESSELYWPTNETGLTVNFKATRTYIPNAYRLGSDTSPNTNKLLQAAGNYASNDDLYSASTLTHVQVASDWKVYFDDGTLSGWEIISTNSTDGAWVLYDDFWEETAYSPKGTAESSELYWTKEEIGFDTGLRAIRTYLPDAYRLGPETGSNSTKLLQAAGNYASKDEVLSVSNKVAEIEEAIDIILEGGGGGGGDTPSATEKKIALFIIEINRQATLTNATAHPFAGFELKASTNNFAASTTDNVKLQFYAQSEIADTGEAASGGSLGIDKMKIFYCTPNTENDFRAYTKLPNTSTIHQAQLSTVAVLVDVSCLIRHPENNAKWLSDENEELIWCYHRDKANGHELVPGTDEQLWKPIAPVRWYKTLPAWAQ